MFTGANLRGPIAAGQADYVPIFLSDIPTLIRRRGIKVDTAIVQVSPPDSHGYVSLGVSVDIARAAVQCADTIIAQVNPKMPRTFGEGQIHISHIDAMFHGTSRGSVWVNERIRTGELNDSILPFVWCATGAWS